MDKLTKLYDTSKEDKERLSKTNTEKDEHIHELKDDFLKSQEKCEQLRGEVNKNHKYVLQWNLVNSNTRTIQWVELFHSHLLTPLGLIKSRKLELSITIVP